MYNRPAENVSPAVENHRRPLFPLSQKSKPPRQRLQPLALLAAVVTVAGGALRFGLTPQPQTLPKSRLQVQPMGLLMAAGSSSKTKGQSPKGNTLTGDKAVSELRKRGQYASLMEAFQQSLYAVEPVERGSRTTGAYEAYNPEQQYTTRFEAGGIHLAADEHPARSGQSKRHRVKHADLIPSKQAKPSWKWAMKMRSVGYGTQMQAVPAAVPVANADALVPGKNESNTFAYRRGSVTEWYRNDEKGVEQGFTLHERPSNRTSNEPVQLVLDVDGDLQPKLDRDKKSSVIDFQTAQGKPVLRYSKLVAWDAKGRKLPARMAVQSSRGGQPVRVVLAVEDTSAVYPLTVDPVIVNLEAKLTPVADDSQSGTLGQAVALSGNTAMIGSITANAVYVFVRSGSTWSFAQKVTPSDGGGQFGISIGIDGDTAAIGASSNNNYRGAAYVFVRSGNVWSEQQKLTASDAAEYDFYGSSVALSGETVLVGNSGTNTAQGAGYVYVRTGTTWSEQAKLTASDGAAVDLLGDGVALSGDTALLGATGADRPGAGDAGAAYVFVRNGTTWSEQQKLTASDGANGDLFGISLDLEGDTALIGARSANAAYIFVRNGVTWSQQQKLTASGSIGGGGFGGKVALDGSSALIGAVGDDGSRGAAYVFVGNGGTWSQQAKLTVSGGVGGDQFGDAVALSGDTALVSETGGRGAAYTFTRNGGAWTQQQKLTATVSDAANNDRFGTSVSLSGESALIGAHVKNNTQGAAYVFTRNGGAWTQQAKLTAGDAANGDQFGISVSLDGDSALIGAFGKNNLQGAAYVFTRSGGAWTQQQKLTAGDAANNDYFGYTVSLDGDSALISADAKNNYQGAAYVFTRSGGAWSEQQKLTAGDAANNDYFSYGLSIDGDTTLIGAFGKNNFQGAAYVFTRSGNTWTQQQKLTAGDAANNDYFGYDVSLSGDSALIGAIGKNNSQGAAYVFTRSGSAWSQQARLAAGDAANNDSFGISVSLDSDRALIGARGKNSNQGAAYVFTRNGSTWTQGQKLTAFDAANFDQYGYSVSLDGDTALIGAYGKNNAQGAAYTYRLTNDPAPTVTGITRLDTNPTNAASVRFQVKFSEAVTGVDKTDFALTTTGLTGAAVGTVTGNGDTYTVTVNSGTGDGTLRLDVTDDDSIKDSINTPLNDTGAGNGNFTTGETYTIDKTAPTISIGAPSKASAYPGESVTFTVTYSGQNAISLAAGDIMLNKTGSANATVAVSGSGNTRTVTLSNLQGNGTLGISIAAGTASDIAGNLAPAAGPGATVTLLTPALTLSAPQTMLGEGASMNVTVTRNGPTDAALTVTLTADAAQLTVPATVTIAAGQAFATFTVTAVDDTLVNGNRTTSIGASATATTGGTLSISISDNDMTPTPTAQPTPTVQPTPTEQPTPDATPVPPQLTLTIAPSIFNENAGPAAAVGTLTRNGDTTEALTVRLVCSDTSEISLPRSVEIPSGANSLRFFIGALDDHVRDGDHTVNILATAAGYPVASDSMRVLDNGVVRIPLSVDVKPGGFLETAGQKAAIGTVSIPMAAKIDFAITLSSSDEGEARVPRAVTIKAGRRSANFYVSAVDDSEADSVQPVTITARRYGFGTATETVKVGDDDESALLLTLDAATVAEGGAVRATVTRNRSLPLALTVLLTSAAPEAANVQPAVTIPAGQASTSFYIYGVRDGLVGNNRSVLITASRPGSTSDSETLTVVDSNSANVARAASKVKLSTASASAATGQVVLTFTGGLDSSSVIAAAFRVTVGGEAVAVEAVNYNGATSTVKLLLDGDNLPPGSIANIAWSGLLDSAGAELRGQTTVTAR